MGNGDSGRRGSGNAHTPHWATRIDPFGSVENPAATAIQAVPHCVVDSHLNQQLSPEHKELYQRVDEVLHYLWKPFGDSGVPEARDEYDSYVPHVFSLLVSRAGAGEWYSPVKVDSGTS